MILETPLIDIRPDHWEIVRGILKKHVSQYEVWAFGSRATWKAKEFSDLDLAIITEHPLSLDISSSLSDDFSNSDLPYKVDAVDWATTSESFRKIIKRDKVVVQEGKRSFRVMNGWRSISLGEIFKVKHGFAFKSEFFTDQPHETVLVTPGNFTIGGGFQDVKRKYYSGPVPEDYVLKPGQIVVTMTDLSKESDTLGYAARIPNDSTTWLHNQRVGLLEFRSLIPVSPRFVQYLLRSHEYRSWIVGSATGTTVKHTAPGRIESFTTFIPPIEEQRAIAHILGTLDDKIELNRKQNETLEAMVRTLFKAWFVDFEPVRAKMEDRWKLGQSLPGLPAHLYDLFPDRLVDSEFGEIPEGWCQGSLGDVAVHPRRSVQPEEIKSETPYIALEHMPKRCIGLAEWDVANGLESNKYEFKKGEILFGKLRPYFHKVGVAPIDGVCSTDIVVVAPKLPIWFGFVLAHASSDAFVEYTNAGSTGTKMPRTSWSEMARYSVVLPHDDVALAFNQNVQSASEEISAKIHESKSLAQLRDSLLPKLISGELRVPDAKRFVQMQGAS